MNLIIERATLLRALSHAQSVVDRRHTIPILANVLLHAEHGRLTMRATDLDLEIIETVACEVLKPGETTLPAALIHGLVSKIPDGAQVSIELTDNGRVRVKGGRARGDVPCISADEYPIMVMPADCVSMQIDAAVLSGLLSRVAFMAPADPKHPFPVICGVYLYSCDRKLRAVATDTVMLGRTEIALPDDFDYLAGITIPSKTAGQIAALLSDAAGVVTLEITDRLIRFIVGETVLTSKLIGQKYPDYARTIPVGNDKPMETDRASFVALLARAALFYEGKDSALIVQCSDGEITASANNTENGDFSETLEVFYNSAPFRFGVNGRKLAKLCGAISGDGLRFVMGGPADPIIISDPADDSSMYMIPPMRV